jgi:hypothetical protein
VSEEVCTLAGATIDMETERAVRVRHTRLSGWVPKRCIHDDSEVFSMQDRGPGKLRLWGARNKLRRRQATSVLQALRGGRTVLMQPRLQSAALPGPDSKEPQP